MYWRLKFSIKERGLEPGASRPVIISHLKGCMDAIMDLS